MLPELSRCSTLSEFGEEVSNPNPNLNSETEPKPEPEPQLFGPNYELKFGFGACLLELTTVYVILVHIFEWTT
jgi:hypothetical protein